MQDNQLGWGILGTGRIARTFATAIADSSDFQLAAVGSRTETSATTFAKSFGFRQAYGSYGEVLADPEVDAVYIALPNHLHAEHSIAASELGKHVLCEKPLAIDLGQARQVVDVASRNGTYLMEAFMFRFHPQIAKLVELLQDGVIGDIRHIHASFGFDAGPSSDGYRHEPSMGGGGILDVGCYCTSAARLVAGVALGKAFAEPLEVRGTAAFPTGSRVDLWATASLKFPKDITANLVCGMGLKTEWALRVYGSQASIHLPDPWLAGDPKIEIHRPGATQPEVIQFINGRNPYLLEAESLAERCQEGQPCFPAMDWEDTLGNMETLDRWRAAVD